MEIVKLGSFEKAMEIALKAHAGQVDKAGMPYILHPIFVSTLVETLEEKTVAILHDVLEDSQVRALDLERDGFKGSIIKAVLTLTKKQDQDYKEYLKEVKSNQLARKVKLADLRHNMDISRIPNPKEKDIMRIEKYKEAIRYLASAT